MAGPQDIQRPARGLTDLLGLRATGDSPHVFSDSVFGSLEMLDLYLADRRTSTKSVLSAAVAGTGYLSFGVLPAVTVQPGTAFLVYSAWTSYTVPAVSTWSGALVVRRASFVSLQGLTLIAAADRTVAAADTVQLGRYFERPLLMLPGDDFGLQTLAFTGTGSQPGLWVDYAVIQV